MWRQVVVYIKNKSQMRADNIHLNNQHVLKTTENTEGRRVIAVCHYFDLRHDYYFFFKIFSGGRAGKNTQSPLLPLMRISAPDTAAGGVGMMVWEKGGGLVYLLKISRRCAQGMLVHSFELSACSKNHREHRGHREQAGDCGVFIITICTTAIISSLIYFPADARERISNRPPFPSSNQCTRHGSRWCWYDGVGGGGRVVISTKN